MPFWHRTMCEELFCRPILIHPGQDGNNKNKNKNRSINPEKVTAERLNGYAALFGCIAPVGAYATTGQIIPGFV